MSLCVCSDETKHPHGCHFKQEVGHSLCAWCLDVHGWRMPAPLPAVVSVTHGPGELVTITVGPCTPAQVLAWARGYVAGML